MQRISRIAIAAVCAAFVCGSGAEARSVAFSNMPKGSEFDHIDGQQICGAAGICFPDTYSSLIAQSFTPPNTGTLDHLDLGLLNFGSASGSLATGIAVALVPDNNNAPMHNTTALEEWVVAKIPLYPPAAFKTTKLTSKRHPALIAGKKYWVVVLPTAYDTNAGWMNNTQGQTPGYRSTDGGHTWFASGNTTAFDVWIQ